MRSTNRDAYCRRIRLTLGWFFRKANTERYKENSFSFISRAANAIEASLNFLIIVFGKITFLNFNQGDLGFLIFLSH